MKIQLFFPKDLRPYLEFNPTLGYIQGSGSFEIWLKLRPDRTILTTCAKYLVKQDDEAPPKDEYEEFTMRVPVKVTGASQVLPVKFSVLCVFTVNAVSFSPPQLDFGNVFSKSASRVSFVMENHSLLPQKFSFVRLPREIYVVTDHGTGQLLPGEKYQTQIEYRPTQPTIFDENNVFCRLVTGEICAREVKIPYCANVTKCPLTVDKQKIEYPALPESEEKEIVLELKNNSHKNYMVEVVPPNLTISGILVNPLVVSLTAGRSSLVSVKYSSKFRSFNSMTIEDLKKPKVQESSEKPKDLASINKKLAERLEKKKKQQAEA